MTRRRSAAVRLAPIPLALGLVAAFSGAARAEEPDEAWWRGTVSMITENDYWAFRGQDQYYSNGLRLGWTSDPIGDKSWLAGVAGFARKLPMFEGARDIRFGVGIGQSFYTPEDTDTEALQPDDRPYAGWLYATAALIGESFENGDVRKPRRLDTLALSLGVMGPLAGGEITQNQWHSFIGETDANGWDNQIPNQPGVMLYYERKWRAAASDLAALDPSLEFDFMPQLGVALGNVQTYAAAGALLRFGHRLDLDWGPDRIQPGLAGTSYARRTDGFSWYVFGGMQGRAVAYDAFLQGPWFTSSPSVDPEPFVVDLQGGAVVAWDQFRFGYTYVFRSKEFEGQNGIHRFGSVNLTIGF